MKMRGSVSLIPVYLAVLMGLCYSVSGQDLDNVTIRGRIMDQYGGVLPGSTVTANLVTTGATRTVVTDADGGYLIIELEPGVYTLRVSAKGFAPQERTGLTLISGQNLQLEIVLLPEGLAAAVTVGVSDTPVVDTTRTVVGGTVTTNEIESLPIASRSVLDLIFTLPGVSEEALSTRDLAEDRNSNASGTPEESGTFSLSGGPAYSNNITIDGLDNNDDRAARERFQPSVEAVDEVQVITNQFSAEYGRASGGRINIRTRGGSNNVSFISSATIFLTPTLQTTSLADCRDCRSSNTILVSPSADQCVCLSMTDAIAPFSFLRTSMTLSSTPQRSTRWCQFSGIQCSRFPAQL